MADREIGYIELTATTRIIFAVGSWKGQSRASIRKFVTTEKYAGPTKSGMSLDGATVVQLLAALRVLQATIPTNDPNQHVSVGKTRDWEIRIAIVPPDEDSRLPSVDIREYVDSARYAGPTKAGVRFGWDKLKQFAQLAEVLVQQLGVAASAETTLFPDMKPQWVSDAQESLGAAEHKPAPHGFDATSLKSFPDAFLPAAKFEVEQLKLPADVLRIGQDRGGQYFVTDDSGFHRPVRNEVEGKFFLYSQRCGATELSLPKEMIKVFSAVASYEKYCRELRQKLIRDFETRSRNRALAEHMAQETMQTHGLPIC
jgi:hypothetical protein